MNALETHGLGKRYRRTWALRDCTLAVPAGHVVALVGPNGAGKSTLLHLTVGLTAPTTGALAVFGDVAPGAEQARNRIGFVAQDTPLYPNLSVADTLRLVACLTPRFDMAAARARLAAVEIPLDRRVGRLSGGQHAQVALAVALARHPDLLVFDEPVARLDPLARHEFMATLMEAVADEGISVILSSHVVAELERVCDYLVVLSHGAVQVSGAVDGLLDTHRIVTGPTAEAQAVAASVPVVRRTTGERITSLLVRTDSPRLPPNWRVEHTNLEELVLSYLRSPEVSALPGPNARERVSA